MHLRNAYSPFLLLIPVFIQCTKPTVHYLRPIALVTPESRELFGCRVNGKPFSPLATDSASLGSCTNYNVYNHTSGFRFEITANRHESACRFFSLSIVLDSVEVRRGQAYALGSPGIKRNYARYTLLSDCSQSSQELYTSDDLPGTLMITRYDTFKKVVHGTFDFKVKDHQGNLYRISDGIFDRHFKN
jgi:hypothetical protein